MANDNRYVSKSNFIYIWQSIWQFVSSKFVKKEIFDKKIEELKDDIADSFNADEVYIMSEGETEEDIPDNAVVVVFPDEESEEIDWTNYYNKKEINEIIQRAEFKRGKSAYEVAVEKGFEGSEEEWLLSLKGKNAYEIATELGFEGSLAEWFESLKGEDGYTPQKGVDYFDGYTPQKNVDYFDGQDGYTPQKDKDYFDGQDGEDGYTPQRGKDYWTNEDIATIQTYVDILVSELVDSAPETLDTLWELAKALGNDPNFATTIAEQIGKKADKNVINTELSNKADKSQAIFYIEGTGTTAGTWLGSHDDITSYFEGLTIAYKVGIAGASDLTLNINNLGAIPVVRNVSTAVTTHYGVNSIVILTYTDDDGTAYWKISDYDSDTKTRSSNKVDAKMFIIGASSQSTSGQTTYSNKNCYIGADNCLYSNGAKVSTMTEDDIKTLIKTIVLDGYLGGKQIRYVNDANDTGETGYLTIKG